MKNPPQKTRPINFIVRGARSKDGIRLFWGFRNGAEIWVKPESFERLSRQEDRRRHDHRMIRFLARAKRDSKNQRNSPEAKAERQVRKNKEAFAKHLRASIDLAFKVRGMSRRCRFDRLLDASTEKVKEHIESLFPPGMNWLERERWTVGYIVPLSIALTSAELRVLHHYSNLRPIWLKDRAESERYPLSIPAGIDLGVRALWEREQEI